MPSIISKLPEVGTTIFTVMSSLAKEHNAVNLGQGFPDFDMNEELIAKVNEAMQKGYNQYTHMNGYLPLREVLAEKIANLYGSNIHADTEITITPGGTYAIYTALTSVLQPGDEVIIFQPGYDSYIPNVLVNDATPVLIPLQYPNYSINWDAVRKAITPRTRMIMLNSPHNPTGAILRQQDIEALRTLVTGTDIFILSDEVYEHIIFDALPHQSMLRYPDLLERSFVCFSFGKIYHCTGWKIGYCVAPAAVMTEFRKVHQFNCFSTDTPKQVALASFLKQKDQYEFLGALIQQKRDYFLRLMKDTKFNMHQSHGSYFILGSYGHFSDEAEKDIAIRITKDYGVATIPVSAFYRTPTDNKVLRFCFCKKKETLEKAVERLRRV
jgi:methionine aminotransferase